MSREELTAAMARACAKIVDGINHLSDAQMVYLMGVVDGMEGSTAAMAAMTAAATEEETKPQLREVV